MPEYLSPGVYVEEVSSGIRPIEGVGTSTGAFIGVAEKGPIGGARYEDGPGRPVLITNFGDFTRTFGGFINGEFLAYAVQQFFGEGGTRCYVTRAAHFGNSSDPSSLTATRAFWPSRGMPPPLPITMPPTAPPAPITLTAALAANATTATLSSLTGIANGTVLYINDGTNGIRARVTGTPAANTVTFAPPVPAGGAIASGTGVTPLAMVVNAITEGEWGNNLSVAVSVSGRVQTALSAAMAAGATTATLTSIQNIEEGMTLFLTDTANAALVQVVRLDAGTNQITFQVLETVPPPAVGNPPTVPALAVGATATGLIFGKASTALQTAAATGATNALLQSAEGITVGSILLFITRAAAVETINRVLVNRVVGNRVFFTPALSTNFPSGPLPGTPVTLVTTEDFTITVFDGDDVVETHANLSMENTNLVDYVEDRVNLGTTRSRYIRVDESQLQNVGNNPPDRTPGPRRLGGLPGTGGNNGGNDVR